MRNLVYARKKMESMGETGADPILEGDGLSEPLVVGVVAAPGEGTSRPNSSTAPPARAQAKVGNEGSIGLIAADRPIFTVSVAADLLGLHPRTLRIYEEKGLVLPARTMGNRRRYSQNDIERFSAIRRLTQGGVNLEGVRVILDMAGEVRRLGGDPNAIIERNLQALGSE